MTEKSVAPSNLYRYDQSITAEKGIIIGTDEAGRGPLAGPVVCAAVILDLTVPINGIDDSKKLTEKKREHLYPIILREALSVTAAVISPHTIDSINILQSSLQGMYNAIEKCSIPWDYVLVDGNKTLPSLLSHKQDSVVRGDSTSASIAAASIVAKVLRDRIMRVYHHRYPAYNFAQHKGYPTLKHRQVIKKVGISPIHRVSFCTKLLSQTSLFD